MGAGRMRRDRMGGSIAPKQSVGVASNVFCEGRCVRRQRSGSAAGDRPATETGLAAGADNLEVTRRSDDLARAEAGHVGVAERGRPRCGVVGERPTLHIAVFGFGRRSGTVRFRIRRLDRH